MAPLPTIPNAVRCALIWNSVGGVRPVNVLHLITSSEDATAIGAALDDAFNEVGNECFAAVASVYHPEQWQITFLDGTSATQNVAAATTNGGLSSTAPVPAVAAVISFRTLQRGPRGRGRLYLGPLGEGNINNGLIEPSAVTDMVTAWQGVDNELAASPVAASLGVASYVHSEIGGVSSISMRGQCGTQRRRQDQLV